MAASISVDAASIRISTAAGATLNGTLGYHAAVRGGHRTVERQQPQETAARAALDAVGEADSSDSSEYRMK